MTTSVDVNFSAAFGNQSAVSALRIQNSVRGNRHSGFVGSADPESIFAFG
jgi:hypothetical protein